MSKSLINENPILLLPSLAVKIGLNNAIVLQQIHFWCQIAKDLGHGKSYKNETWVYKTAEEWQKKDFPFWSLSTVKRVFSDLNKRNLIHSDYLDSDKWNRTLYYRINMEKINEISMLDDCNSIVSNRDNALCQIDTMDSVNLNQSIVSDRVNVTEITTEITTENNTHNKKGENSKKIVKEILDLWYPDLGDLNEFLESENLGKVTQQEADKILFNLNSHYMNQINDGTLNKIQMYSKFVSWCKRDLNKNNKNYSQTKKHDVSLATHQSINEMHDENPDLLKPVGSDFDRAAYDRSMGLIK